ncbi:MAG: UDP-galactopyranose mutase [Clostridiales bacterium]|jgi:UDP-galactopyranose mutase|nr:UDP-galactopyranose mutase [Clostridiales bacterium]
MYDYLVVGAGLFGGVFAREMHDAGKRVLVVDRRAHPGGNCYTEVQEGIHVHKYGAHIFHTSDAVVWRYVTRLAEFNGFINAPVANYHGKLYNLPFNMNTFYQMWGVTTPKAAQETIARQVTAAGIGDPQNLEEQAVKLVGTDIYERLVKGYTEKQWGRPCRDLPAFLIRRLPLRFTFDNNYFTDRYQGIPIGGYTQLFERLFAGIEVRLGTDYIRSAAALSALARHVVYTGCIDEYYGYRFGALAYRSLHFETEVLAEENHQGNAVINYTDGETPYTRILEHKHFDPVQTPKSVVTREYPRAWTPGDEAYYPVNDEQNARLYERYAALARAEKNVTFAGRLGSYRYLDMAPTVAAALALCRTMQN